MAQVTRIKVTQPDGETKKPVAFLSDIKLDEVKAKEGDLITVTTDNKTATVSVDSNILSIENGNVKVNKPLEFEAQTTVPTETTGLRAVIDGSETKLYWGSNVIEAHDPGEGYVKTATFDKHANSEDKDINHVTDDQLDALENIAPGEKVVTDTMLEPIEDAIDAVDTKADATLDIIGVWSTIRDTTVKKAIEDAEKEIAKGLSEITAGTSGEGVTVTIGAKSNKSQTVAVSVQDGTTTQKGIVQLADAHNASDSTKAATGSSVASAINTFDANVIGSWTDGGKYTGTVKSAIESLAAISMFKVVSVLPATGETNTIYIVKPDGQATGPYAEYIWVDDKWEKIGDTDIQLENYYKKSEIGGTWTESNTLSAYVNTQDNALNTRLTTVESKLGDATGDDDIDVTVSNTALTVRVKDNSTLAKILEVCEIDNEEE